MLQTVFRASLANKWIFLAKIRQRDCYFIYNQCLDWASRKYITAGVWNYTLYIGFIHIAHVSTEFLHESFLDKEAFIMSSLGHLIQRKD